jgi:redox-sensitive bicupin YhaK (pirin superfamily)
MLDLVIDERRRDLGGFEVGRVLPFAKHRMVGPFIFFDHMGPIDFPAGIPRSVDVRRHRTTVTYWQKGYEDLTESALTNGQQPSPMRNQLD